MTVSPTLGRSSAVTIWIKAHCSPWEPGGVSQRICQSLKTERTTPWAAAGAAMPASATSASAIGRRNLSGPNEPIGASIVESRPTPEDRITPPAHGKTMLIVSRQRLVKACHCGRDVGAPRLGFGLAGAPAGPFGRAEGHRRGIATRCIAVGLELWFDGPGFQRSTA